VSRGVPEFASFASLASFKVQTDAK
jgi:hypothetical protein